MHILESRRAPKICGCIHNQITETIRTAAVLSCIAKCIVSIDSTSLEARESEYVFIRNPWAAQRMWQ